MSIIAHTITFLFLYYQIIFQTQTRVLSQINAIYDHSMLTIHLPYIALHIFLWAYLVFSPYDKGKHNVIYANILSLKKVVSCYTV